MRCRDEALRHWCSDDGRTAALDLASRALPKSMPRVKLDRHDPRQTTVDENSGAAGTCGSLSAAGAIGAVGALSAVGAADNLGDLFGSIRSLELLTLALLETLGMLVREQVLARVALRG